MIIPPLMGVFRTVDWSFMVRGILETKLSFMFRGSDDFEGSLLVSSKVEP